MLSYANLTFATTRVFILQVILHRWSCTLESISLVISRKWLSFQSNRRKQAFRVYHQQQVIPVVQ